MPFESGAIHAPQHLVDLCVSYNPQDDGQIRSLVFPRKPVSHETDLIATVSKADSLRLYDLDVSGRGELPEVTFRTSGDLQYHCKPIAAKAEINPKDVKNADAAYTFEKRQTMIANGAVSRRMEYLAVKQTLRNTAVMTNYQTYNGSTRWDAFASVDSQPIEDLQAAVRVVRIKTGTSANISRKGGKVRVFLHEYTWMTLQQHPNVLSRIAFNPAGTGAVLTIKVLADMLDIAEADIVITASQFTSSQQGPGITPAYNAFIGADVIVAMTDDDPENDQAIGHEFVFDGLGGDEPFLVSKWRENGKGIYMYTDFVGVACMADYLITNPDAGFLLQGVLDTTNTNRYHGLLA